MKRSARGGAGQSGPADPRLPAAISRLPIRSVLPVLLLLSLLALALRASDLRADPPINLSVSMAPYTDEGLDTYAARNWVLYGKWKVDDFNPFVIYPLVNILVAFIFKIFGIGFVQVKILSVLAGVASVALLYLLVREEEGDAGGLIAGVLLATSYPLVMYSRLGLVESVQILFLIAAGLFFVRGLRRPREMTVSGAVVAGTVLLVKISALFLLPLMAGMFLWEFLSGDRSRRRRSHLRLCLGRWLLGVGAVVLVWLAAVVLPYRTEYFHYVLRHSLESPAGHPGNLVAYLSSAFTIGVKTRLNLRLSAFFLLGLASLAGLAMRRPGMRYCAGWLLGGMLMLGYMNYRPDRYEIILIPAVIAGFAGAMARLLTRDELIPPTRPTLVKSALYVLWLWPVMVMVLIYSRGFWGLVPSWTDLRRLVFTLGMAITGGLLGVLVLRRARGGISLRWPILRALLVSAMVFLVLQGDFLRFRHWYARRTHTLIDWSRQLDQSLPEHSVLAGIMAPALLLESHKRAVCVSDWVNAEDPVGRFGVTHLIAQEGGPEYKLFQKLYPDQMAEASDWLKFKIRDQVFTLYTLPRKASSGDAPRR